MRKLMKQRRGQVGLDTAKAVMLSLLTIAVIAFAIIVALSALGNSNALEEGSQEANDTDNILNNVTGGVSDFFSNTGTWMALLAVVVIILIISIVIFAVNRFGGRTGGL